MAKQFLAKLQATQRYQVDAEPKLLPAAAHDVEAAFKELLEGKHLYQSVEISTDHLAKQSAYLVVAMPQRRFRTTATVSGTEVPRPTTDDFIFTGRTFLERTPWLPDITDLRIDTIFANLLKTGEQKVVRFSLPKTIVTHCKVCKDAWPFNPVLDRGKMELGSPNTTDQWFFTAYACQKCKTEPIRFLVRRQGLKLRLCGRDPISDVSVPSFLPKEQREHFAAAVVAVNAGQTLAGLFFLRVFVEQFYRAVPTVATLLAKEPRLTGDKMGEMYHATLPADFKTRFPSLPSVYSELSEAMHKADASLPIYQKSAQAIVAHFDARRVFGLNLTSQP